MKREDLALVTSEQFRDFDPRWLKTGEWCARCERVAAMRAEWNALDVLCLEDVCARDKLWLVLRPQFLPPMLLHEFACRCAEWALSLVENPDARSVEAIRVKRRWMAGEATDIELRAAQRAAGNAAEVDSSDVRPAAASARDAAWAAVCAAAWSVEIAAVAAARLFAAEANETSTYEHEVEILRNLINEWEE